MYLLKQKSLIGKVLYHTYIKLTIISIFYKSFCSVSHTEKFA